jgi:flagellar biosynthesis activator protein FlaF
MRSSLVSSRGKRPKSVLSDREAEAAVLMKAAAMLKHVQSHWASPDRHHALDEVLRYNQKLWTFFQASVQQASNPLPARIKEDVLRLGAFVHRKTFEIIAYPSGEKIDVLISVNTNIAAGLKNPGA